MHQTPRVEIVYCTQCRWMLRAAWMAQELLTTFADELGEVALVPGTGGVFQIRVEKRARVGPRGEGRIPRHQRTQANRAGPHRPGQVARPQR